ncbi:MAG: glycoside hydrolase family 9 protein [Oscillospiraceae bacterium]|nr:glycoside hydrolase family 9 protein [Oscillospiraceae bacterium]
MKRLVSILLAVAMAALLISGAAAEPPNADATDFIVIDQFGYRPDSSKTAVIRNPKQGPDSALSFTPGNSYSIVNAETGESVFKGAPTHKFDLDAASGDEIWWFDFSSVTQPGRYYVLDEQRNARSFTFSIADDVYNEVLKHAGRMFFYQRSGFAKAAPYADSRWTDSASHQQDKDCRLYSAPDNAALGRDLHGGWFDAGDYNKYTAWTSDYVENMLSIYRERPEAFGDNWNIPESGNGVPDILDEARWGMDFLLRLQNDNSVNYSTLGIPGYPTNVTDFDGSVLSIVGYAASGNSPPSTDNSPSRYGPPNTIATISAAKAYALGAIVFEEFDAAYAARLRTAALKAYEWADRNPAVYFKNNTGDNNSNGLGAGNQDPDPDGQYNISPRLVAKMQAGFYLNELTGEKKYLTPFEQNDAYKSLPLYAWGHMDMYRFENHTMYLNYLRLADADPAIAANVRAQLSKGIQPNFASKIGTDGYRSYLEQYPWGSNQHKGNTGSTFWYFAELDIDPAKSIEYADAAEDYLRYIHGVNPLNTVYLTNMNDYGASRSMTTIYHNWYSKWNRNGVSDAGPPPGYLPGGANAGFNVDGVFPGNLGVYGNPQSVRDEITELGNKIRAMAGGPPAKMYVDTDHTWPINTWEISEPMGAYQLTYIRLLSKFVQPVDADKDKDKDKEPVEKYDLRIEVLRVGGVDIVKITNVSGDTLSVKGLRIVMSETSQPRRLPAIILRDGVSFTMRGMSDNKSIVLKYAVVPDVQVQRIRLIDSKGVVKADSGANV